MFWHFVFQSLIKIFEMILFDQSGVCVYIYPCMKQIYLVKIFLGLKYLRTCYDLLSGCCSNRELEPPRANGKTITKACMSPNTHNKDEQYTYCWAHSDSTLLKYIIVKLCDRWTNSIIKKNWYRRGQNQAIRHLNHFSSSGSEVDWGLSQVLQSERRGPLWSGCQSITEIAKIQYISICFCIKLFNALQYLYIKSRKYAQNSSDLPLIQFCAIALIIYNPRPLIINL